MVDEGTLAVWTRARAVDGRANEAITRLIAEQLGLRPRQVVLVAGLASRRKIVDMELASCDEARARLTAAGANTGGQA